MRGRRALQRGRFAGLGARAISRSEHENRTGQSSADGQNIQNHAARGLAVHLFVRSQKKRAGGGAAPFVYCEDVWRGEKPITVQWKLSEAVPGRPHGDLGVPDVPRQRA